MSGFQIIDYELSKIKNENFNPFAVLIEEHLYTYIQYPIS